MKSTITTHVLRDSLERQRDVATELLKILTQEFAALSGNDLQGLETSLAAKHDLMEQLEGYSREFLAAAEFEAGGKKLEIVDYLRTKDSQGTQGLATIWRQVEDLLSQCHHKNSVNGKIISLNHRHTQQALEILRYGGQGPQPCYTRSGAAQSAASSRILGRV